VKWSFPDNLLYHAGRLNTVNRFTKVLDLGRFFRIALMQPTAETPCGKKEDGQ
jgi:hypothetical protein